MQTSRSEFWGRELLCLLGSLCNLNRIPFDLKLVEQEFSPPHSLATFNEAARALGFKTRLGTAYPTEWQTLPLTAIGFLRAIPETESKTGAKVRPGLILKTDGRKLLYFRAGSQTPETITTEEGKLQFESELILVACESKGREGTIPGFEAETKPFGFRWFVPELLKHKTIWRDVLLASLAIQLVSLATLLFTQIIVDKVVVHHTHSTLIVLGVALVMFILFTSCRICLHQYLVLHTGNRIDAVLGSQLWRGHCDFITDRSRRRQEVRGYLIQYLAAGFCAKQGGNICYFAKTIN